MFPCASPSADWLNFVTHLVTWLSVQQLLKETAKLCITYHLWREFISNAEMVFISWRHQNKAWLDQILYYATLKRDMNMFKSGGKIFTPLAYMII